ncbi:hypothetical protein [Actinokineospora inagensis]|uniref:hypothetical protein n=1 Tax=Actinokineospora inagensis TaxID=103730 RepID=UPI00047A1258|nr:hypothetical protein [Actinokineospora inagensis]
MALVAEFAGRDLTFHHTVPDQVSVELLPWSLAARQNLVLAAKSVPIRILGVGSGLASGYQAPWVLWSPHLYHMTSTAGPSDFCT